MRTGARGERAGGLRPQVTPALPVAGSDGVPVLRAAYGEDGNPQNTLIGHLVVAVVAGALCLLVFGLYDARVGAAALSLALTGAVLLLLRASHPPSGATVLIVGLGLLKTPVELAMIMAGVVLLTVAGWTINRALGTPVPVWAPRSE